MKHQYKSHEILITTWASLDGFTTELRISKQAPNIFQSLKINRSFPTKAEAEMYALEVAKRRIDNVSPDPAKDFPETASRQFVSGTQSRRRKQKLEMISQKISAKR